MNQSSLYPPDPTCSFPHCLLILLPGLLSFFKPTKAGLPGPGLHIVSPAPEAFFFPPWASKSFFVLHIAVKCHLSVAPCPSTLQEPPLHASHKCLPLSPEDYFSCCLTDMTKKKKKATIKGQQTVPFHWLPLSMGGGREAGLRSHQSQLTWSLL